jgi:hypothetical protein
MNQINVGSHLSVKQMHNVVSTFKVTGYNEANYMLMEDVNDSTATMTIHPQHVKRILNNVNGDSGINILDCISLNNVEAIVVMSALPRPEAVKATVIKTVATVTKAAKVPGAPSKKEQAAAIKAANPTLSRKEIIALFVSQLNMSEAGASTYYSHK